MEITDAVYTIGIICMVAITLVVGIVGYQATRTLQRIRVTLEKIEGMTFVPDIVRHSAEAGLFGLAGWILQKLKTGR
ncbi:MAG: hypothetical protein NUV98_00070 [Candidatus Roizmanbacteria bacterium]|nr:hypothetical protein [Candidatus Roizmanbacteria bacterium]